MLVSAISLFINIKFHCLHHFIIALIMYETLLYLLILNLTHLFFVIDTFIINEFNRLVSPLVIRLSINLAQGTFKYSFF